MKTTYRRVLDRRTLLRGAAGVVLGLPWLDEMTECSVYAQAPEAPLRALNVFFGLGYQRAIQDDGLSSETQLIPLEPLVDRFGSRLAFLRGVDQSLCNGVGNSHFDGAAGAFTGTPANRISTSKNITGGASIDQALRAHAHPEHLPAGVLGALNTGSWWRFSDSTQRYIHSRLPDGTPAGAANPPQDPVELFEVLFGASPVLLPTGPSGEIDPEARAALQVRRSILDGLTQQYQYYTTAVGGLSVASRERIRNHFELVRELELQVASALGEEGAPVRKPVEGCSVPEQPSTGWSAHRLDSDDRGSELTVEQFVAENRLMARLFALGVACDRVRFGTFVVWSAGERIALRGDYEYQGRLIAAFDDAETSHEYWHRAEIEKCRDHLHLAMSQVAYFLEQLDAVQEAASSILDTALLTIATESGNGRHVTGELRDVLHVIGSGGGRFRVGSPDYVDVTADGIDLYNTMLAAFGVPKDQRLWDGRGDVAAILT